MTAKRPKPAAPRPGVPRPGPDEAPGSDSELAALWANPAFRAAIEAARADPSGEVTLEEFELEHPLTEGQKAAAEAWLDAYERRLAREAAGGTAAAAPPSANGPPARPPKPARAKKR
jgi:hypothetical protein